MLIDERTVSRGEDVALILKEANRATLIGSQTNGSSGWNLRHVLPGGITAVFSATDIGPADGRPFQRIGLAPDILVKPTIAGVRAGRDEVLERALTYIRMGR
jgi:C-terminal processing protease CtpA/Prc